jgi:hypothetical protein
MFGHANDESTTDGKAFSDMFGQNKTPSQSDLCGYRRRKALINQFLFEHTRSTSTLHGLSCVAVQVPYSRNSIRRGL